MTDIEHIWVGPKVWIRHGYPTSDPAPDDLFALWGDRDQYAIQITERRDVLVHVAGLYQDRERRAGDRTDEGANLPTSDQGFGIDGPDGKAPEGEPPVAEPADSFPFPIKIQNGKPWITDSGSDWRIYLEVPVTSVDDLDSSWSSGPHNNSFEIEKGTAERLVAVVGGERSEPLDLAQALRERGLG